MIPGKLNLHEFAFGATGVNPHFGPARNPWDTERITGGSSSGSAAAVAGGECPAALGTDTGGSIRIPASLCGIVGLKPTYGRVSKRGVLPLSWSLDHVGPMTRTVEDAAIVLQAIAGHDPMDGSTVDEPVPDYVRSLEAGVRGLRIGMPKQFFFENVDPEVEAAVRSAVALLDEMGAEVREVDAPLISDIPGGVTAIMLPEALAYHQKWMAERPDDYGDDVRYRLELGSTYLAVHYVQAQRLFEKWQSRPGGKKCSRESISSRRPRPRSRRPVSRTPALHLCEPTTFSLIRFTNPLNFLGVPADFGALRVHGGRPAGRSAAGRPLVGRRDSAAGRARLRAGD